MKPIPASKLILERNRRQANALGFGDTINTRSNPFRDRSVDSQASGRSRSSSVKRKADDTLSFAAAAKKALNHRVPYVQVIGPEAVDISEFEKFDVGIAKVTTTCDKLATAITDIGDPTVTAICHDLCQAVMMLNENQFFLGSVLKKMVSSAPTRGGGEGHKTDKPENEGWQVFSKKKHRVENNGKSDGAGADGGGEVKAPPTEEEIKEKRFRDAVRDAERSTLIFNLDMGKVPIMNKTTMSKAATSALTAMAASKEGSNKSVPKSETIEIIDDILSVSEKIEFFGRATKTYKNSKDARNGSFCTIPVKYTFRDRETRIMAEYSLRDNCDAHCSVPYPQVLRECIRQTVDAGKKAKPGHSVRVFVDAPKMTLKLSWRRQGAEAWENYAGTIPIPREALDIQARNAPEGLRVQNLPAPATTPQANGRDNRMSEGDDNNVSP